MDQGWFLEINIEEVAPVDTSSQKEGRSRAAKKRDRIQHKQEIYQTSQAKKDRNKTTKSRIQSKKRQLLESMTKEEASQFIHEQKQQKQLTREKMQRAVQVGLPILIDCSFEDKMSIKERKSLGMQIDLIFKRMRGVINPCSLHVCSVANSIEAILTKLLANDVQMSVHKQDILEVGKQLNKELIYLSPDGAEELEEVSEKYAYVIGGLVDRTILKNASLMRATQLGIKARKLPIGEYMANRKCLNLDHVAVILVKAQSGKDWKEAFFSGAPKRFSKEELSLAPSKEKNEILSPLDPPEAPIAGECGELYGKISRQSSAKERQ